MNDILFYFFLFFLYSVIGWIVEVLFVYFTDGKLVNRGFLIGPYVPIYGFSAVIMVLYLNQYKENPLTIFLLACVICSFFEYVTSYVMEKLFNARWWDYTNSKFNLNGRICLRNSLLFGVLSIFLIYLINPLMVSLVNNLNTTWLLVITIICLIIFVTDTIISTIIVLNIKNKLSSFKLDATVEIRKLIDMKIKKRYFHSRVFKAFPRIKFLKK